MEKIKFPEPKQDYKVLCHCITYNQAKYITDTMNGFCMQKTDFPFVCYIIDDASTDGEQDVIKTYLNDYFDIEAAEIIDIETANVIIAKHKTNESCTFAVYLLKRNLWKESALKQKHVDTWRNHCIFEAVCEGDDYWIDPCKLQKQVDALENNPKATLCYTNFSYVNQYGQEIESSFMDSLKARSHSGNLFKELLREHFVMTATTLYRRRILDSDIYKDAPFTIDYTNTLTAAALGEIDYIPEVTACYRANPNGEMSTNNLNVQKAFDSIQEYFSLLFLDGKIQKPPKRYEDEIKQVICDISYYRAFHHGVKDHRYSFLINVCKRDSLFLLKFINKGVRQMLKKIF